MAESRIKISTTLESLDAETLNARRSVILAKRRARRLAKPIYVNTAASCENGVAAISYVSPSLGNRVAIIACPGSTEAEYLALLMAMQDAERCELPGKIEFRTDSLAVADLNAGSARMLIVLRERVVELQDRHPDWLLVLIERRQNRIAEAPAGRTLARWQTE